LRLLNKEGAGYYGRLSIFSCYTNAMAFLFGKKKPVEKTIIVVDIENGSVGSALVRLSPAHAPKLFGQIRKRVPLLVTRDANRLSEEIEKATQGALQHAHEVAARIRMHAPAAAIGVAERGMVFLHAPWSGVRFEEGSRADVTAVESFLRTIHQLHAASAPDMPVSFHSFGASAAPLLSTVYDISHPTLVCSISSEMIELFIVENGSVAGYGTIPFGTHSLLRTLQSHGGLSQAEALSAMYLESPYGTEAFEASAQHIAREFSDAARELLKHSEASDVLVIGHEPYAQWFAGVLTHEDVGEVFSNGGAVRAVRARHVTPFIAAHAGAGDVPLMLSALFADARFGSV
jgi:hypothetical protein